MCQNLSVLALSSRFDGRNSSNLYWQPSTLSVLALSSRFDGPSELQPDPRNYRLSVLALSSRFDGRVVVAIENADGIDFQYSLCRVVLMVPVAITDLSYEEALSVLALSSRFDGRVLPILIFAINILSVLALSSRFDGPLQ